MLKSISVKRDSGCHD